MSEVCRDPRVRPPRSARCKGRGVTSDPRCGVTKYGADGPGRRSSSVRRGVGDGTTADSLAADRHGPPQDDQTTKTKPPTGSCLRILDQGLGPTRARAARNRPLDRWAQGLGGPQGGLDFPATHAERGSLLQGHPLRTWTRRAGSRAGRIGIFASHPITLPLNDDRLPVVHQPVDQGRG